MDPSVYGLWWHFNSFGMVPSAPHHTDGHNYHEDGREGKTSHSTDSPKISPRKPDILPETPISNTMVSLVYPIYNPY